MHREPCLVQNHTFVQPAQICTVCVAKQIQTCTMFKCLVGLSATQSEQTEKEMSPVQKISKVFLVEFKSASPPLDHQTTPLCDPYLD